MGGRSLCAQAADGSISPTGAGPATERRTENHIESIENDEWVPSADREKRIAEARDYARATMRKDKRMNIRISERDMRNLKIAAMEEGIPYQTLVSMDLHRYLSHRWKNRSDRGTT